MQPTLRGMKPTRKGTPVGNRIALVVFAAGCSFPSSHDGQFVQQPTPRGFQVGVVWRWDAQRWPRGILAGQGSMWRPEPPFKARPIAGCLKCVGKLMCPLNAVSYLPAQQGMPTRWGFLAAVSRTNLRQASRARLCRAQPTHGQGRSFTLVSPSAVLCPVHLQLAAFTSFETPHAAESGEPVSPATGHSSHGITGACGFSGSCAITFPPSLGGGLADHLGRCRPDLEHPGFGCDSSGGAHSRSLQLRPRS